MMGDFFRGWRRKIGLVTLMMSLVFMGGWMRSLSFVDYINLPTDEECSGEKPPMGWYLASTNGYLLANSGPADLGSKWPFPNYFNYVSQRENKFSPEGDCTELQFHLLGVGAGRTAAVSGNDPNPDEVLFYEQTFFVSYWSITVPLTFISFWLLLSKPLKSIQKKIAEPISAARA